MALIVNPGSGGNTNFTDGSIPYSSGGILTENNSNLRWDNATTTLYVNGVSFTPGKYSASSGSSFVGFAQSGTAPTTRTVQDTLRAIVRTGDFALTANFNTAQAALTETIGVKALRIGDGTSTTHQITYPTGVAAGVFVVDVGGATYNGQLDPTYGLGYVETGGPTIGDNLEGHYFDGVDHWIEQNKDYTPNGGPTYRFFGFQINRTTHLATWQWAGASFQFTDVINGTPALQITALGIGIGTSVVASRRFSVAGTQNAASSEFVFDLTAKAGALVTNTFAGIVSELGTAASAFTCTLLQHFTAIDGTKGAGSAITTQTGFRAASLTNGATNIGFSGELASGANVWNAYMSGTANNAFQGNVRIGSVVAPTVALDVTGAGKISTTLTITGAFACNGGTAQTASTGYGTPTNVAKQASFDANSITLPNLAKAVGQLIIDLKAFGFLAA